MSRFDRELRLVRQRGGENAFKDHARALWTLPGKGLLHIDGRRRSLPVPAGGWPFAADADAPHDRSIDPLALSHELRLAGCGLRPTDRIGPARRTVLGCTAGLGAGLPACAGSSLIPSGRGGTATARPACARLRSGRGARRRQDSIGGRRLVGGRGSGARRAGCA
jgi:hypothetical protein